MAKFLEPVAGEGENERRRYPWHEWAAEPFRPVIAERGEDFDVSSEAFEMAVRMYAGRKRLSVAVRRDGIFDRVMFQFDHERKPALPDFPTYEHELAVEGETGCRVCGKALVENFLPHEVLGECIYKNENDRRDTDIYLTHREGRRIPLQAVIQRSLDFTDDGPIIRYEEAPEEEND